MVGNLLCCEWSKYNGGCGIPCDFKKLKYDKESIIARLREEARWSAAAKEKISCGIAHEDAEKLMAEMADKIMGIKIMCHRLEKDFGVGEKELKTLLKGEVRHSFVSDAKVMLALAKMKYSRGKQK